MEFRELRETAYDHADGDKTFSITASERWSIGMVNRLKARFPDDVKIIATNPDGSILAHIPFEWMRIVPKKHVEMSDERKEELAERMRTARMSRTQSTALKK